MSLRDEVEASMNTIDEILFNDNLRRYLGDSRARLFVLSSFLKYFEESNRKGDPLDWLEHGAYDSDNYILMAELIRDYMSGKIKLPSQNFFVSQKNQLKPFLTPRQEIGYE
jgi:hypothetical protein